MWDVFGTTAYNGTIFAGPAYTSALPFSSKLDPNEPSANEVRADEIIDRWLDSKGGWKKLRKLIVAALDEATDDD